jgi:L,D-transpeptidase ErfK/SrfK
VINIPQRLLFLMADGAIVAHYPVGLGRPDWPTFVGAFTIAAKEVDPVWDVPPTIQEELRRAGKPVVTRVPPGPANPLGQYWLGLSVVGYGIHGTNAPDSISKFQTHGCIRMRAADIEDLFDRVEIGTPGASIYEPIVFGNIDGALWMEAHPDVYRRDRRDLLGYVTIEAARLDPTVSLDLEVVKRLLKERAGRPERIDADR